MSGSRPIHFLSGGAPLAHLAFDCARGLLPGRDWRHHVMDDPAKAELLRAEGLAPGVIISFLNPFVVPASMLEGAVAAYNVHPATPRYPGRDSQHFATYDGYRVAGATLHRMKASVDSGEILDVIEQPLGPEDGLARLDELCNHLAVAVLMRNLADLADGAMAPRGRWEWSAANKRGRADFIRMSRLDPSMSPEEIDRRLAAFHVDGYRNKVHVEIGGRYFVYDSRFDAMKRNDPS